MPDCVYCGAPADGSLRDVYGEDVLRSEMVVCADCDVDLQEEPGPWTEWN